MGRRKPGKPRRERNTYVKHEVDGVELTVALPPPLLDLPPTMHPDVERVGKELIARGQTDRVIPIVIHRQNR